MFYDVYLALCKERQKSPSSVANELGINKSNVSNWKNNGYTPRGAALQKIADYFGVSSDYLLGGEDKALAPKEAMDTSDTQDISSQTDFAFYTNYIRLCAERGISPSAAALEIGIRKSNVTYWKSGRNKPSDITLSKIAAYFGVTVDELNSEDEVATVSTFYKNYCRLCSEAGKSVSGVAAEIGLSNAAASGWKKGKVPNDTTLDKLSRYFDVPVEELTSEKGIKKEQSAEIDELSEPEKRLIELFRKLPKETQDSFPAFLEASLKAQGLL